MSVSAAPAVVVKPTLVDISVVVHVCVLRVVIGIPVNGVFVGITIGNVTDVYISVHVPGVADPRGPIVNNIFAAAGVIVLAITKEERTVTTRIRPVAFKNEIDTPATVVIVPGTIIVGIAAIVTIFGTATKEQTGERRRNEKKEFLHNSCAGDRFSRADCMYLSTHF
jgi:hypothetical protein